MDLVVLLAELSQGHDRNYRSLDDELRQRGYSEREIEQAMFWYTSREEPGEVDAVFPRPTRSLRVLSDFERMSISGESYGFLLRLLNLGIIDLDQFERVIARSIPVGPEKIELGDVKAIASSVIFNREMDEVEEDLFEAFDEDAPSA